ncbi:excinuclease ABC subunit UvrC [Neolewinella lacunae]|uniref:UvrABC system protein C n=1 Tax=Neolewinella lacunae TaxID=1517758 RepID=A0A923PK48_9BACT|nr:excinuclease ABC subunit UvrC [Neolewinella lacunae]MBC6993181.1 excinuclease ABC subunit C [Neolewinella lacunae]MDN3637100.1 excinuclease ABC subunit UvrC [Neolewinella lacunae]
MTTEDYKKIADTVPKEPGVYRFIDANGTIIYVGKAKTLRNRVASYFGERKDRLNRTRVMVKNAARLEFTIVNSEADALLLENALIKTHQPRYNVDLKDDKNYSYICIKKERFPRVYITRTVERDGGYYFGPYTSKGQLKIILDLIKELFPLRTCNLNLNQADIEAGKFKVCLEYHIKNCQGPCVGEENEGEYNAKIDQVKNILKGNFGEVKRHFQSEMERLAGEMEFERAQHIKEKLTSFENYQSKSTIVSTSIRDVDVFGLAMDEKEAYLNYIKIVNGAIIHTHTQEITMNLDDDAESLLSYAIPELRTRFNSIAPEIIIDEPLELPGVEAEIVLPKIGDKRKLLDLSIKNAKYMLLQRKKQRISNTNRQTPAERILRTLQADLQMDQLPMHIECFDNSNIQGTNPTSSCVVFKNAKPSKKDYRHFNIKTVEGPDDFASMKEVVHRRYRRLLDEGEPLPQLVIIDGGKGQLSHAMESIDLLGLRGKMTVVGIAKRLEEIYFPDDSVPLHINKKSESLRLIQQCRDESHRFALRHHRNRRSIAMVGTELHEIPGIGEKTVQKLLAHFGSPKKVSEALASEIAEVTNLSVAKKILEHFRRKNAIKE